MQIDNKFSAIWYDTTTAPWTPLTGLSATIIIRRKDTNIIVVNNEAMTEVSLWEYDYTYTGMIPNIPYSYVMNPNSYLAFIETWFIDPRISNLDKSVSDVLATGGYNNMSWVTTSISNLSKKIKEVKDIVEENGNKIDDTKNLVSNIEKLDIQPIIDKIDSIEIIEQKENDLSPIISSLSTIKRQNTKLNTKITGFIEEEKKKEDDMIEMHDKMAQDALDNVDNNEITKALEQVDKEHEQNIINALNSI